MHACSQNSSRAGSETGEKSPRVAGTRCGPPRHRVHLISAVWDLTAPLKIYIIIIVHIHRNEHEFYCVKSLCAARRRPAAVRGRLRGSEPPDQTVRFSSTIARRHRDIRPSRVYVRNHTIELSDCDATDSVEEWAG